MSLKKYSLFLIFLFISQFHLFGQKKIFKQKEVLQVMRKVTDWQLKEWEQNGFNHPPTDWTNGVLYTGLYAAAELKGNEKYLQKLIQIGTDLNWNTGPKRFFADDYCVAQTYAQLSMKLNDPKMIAPFILQADSIVNNAHTEPLNWKNGIHTREWAWCDALFMGPPALAYLSKATGNKKYLDTALKLWWKTTDFLFDSTESLFYRDERFFVKQEKNGEKVFWSRGNGWVLGGLVRVLETMPSDNPDKKRLEKLYIKMVERISDLQQADGSWHASLLDPQSYSVKEVSGTGLFCYAILWGLNKGLLDKKTYWPVAKKAWTTMVASVHSDGKLGFVQPIGSSPGSVNENSTEVYGVGAFLLSGSQLYQYIKSN